MHEPDYLKPATLSSIAVGGILPPDPTTGYACIVGKTLLAYPEGPPRGEYEVEHRQYSTIESYSIQRPYGTYVTRATSMHYDSATKRPSFSLTDLIEQ